MRMRAAERREQIYAFMRDRFEAHGPMPASRELGRRFGISNVAAWKHVKALVEEGRLLDAGKGQVTFPDADPPIDLRAVRTSTLRAELARRGVTFEALQAPRLPLGEGRACAANQCHNRVQRGHLMCREHWWKLEPRMRTAILRAYNSRDSQGYSDAVETARDFLGGFTHVVERCE